MVVEGTPVPVVVRRKSDVAGVWLNTSSVTFASVPSYYAIASNAPDRGDRRPAGAGAPRHRLCPHQDDAGARLSAGRFSDFELAAFKAAVIRLKQEEGLYVVEAKDGVTFTGRSLFRSTIALPANVPVGPLVARTYLFRNGEVLSAHIARVTLEREGIERVLHDFRVPLSVHLRADRGDPRRASPGSLASTLLPPRGGVSAAAQSPLRSRVATG